jgi:hypothetical protein
MMIEDEFGITVPDKLVNRMLTVGDFYDAILPLVRESGFSPAARAAGS